MPHVVIVGAGVAGLSATRLLSQQHSFKVTLLEATGRVGGRVKSTELGTETVDLGASWMHYIRENPLFDEALSQNWPMAFTDNVMSYYTQRGRVPRDAGVLPVVEDVNSMIAGDYHQEKPLKPEMSLKAYVEAALENMPLISAEQAHLAAMILKLKGEHFAAQPWHEIPASEGGNQNELGRNAFVCGKGYGHVLEWLHATTDWNNVEVKLNEEVQNIASSSSGNGLTVQTRSARYEADYVVCTIPLGALKAAVSQLFDAALLPSPLLQAISQTEVAELGKIALRFDKPFWDGLEQELSIVNTQTKEIFTVVNPYKASAATLVVLTGPPVTQKVEKDPSIAFETVKWALEAIRVDPSVPVPQPLECVVTDWTQLPQFRGSYSARAIGQNFDDMIDPFIEGCGRLRFAGEHTTLNGNGCVHGAYLSGIREAERIVESIQ